MIEKDYRHKKFLIIDDFESFQKILKRLLHGLNAQDIDMVNSGTKAVHICESNAYDVIFCDFDLGQGPNGLQVLEELRHLNRLKNGAIFIMVTAESSRDAVIGSLEYKPDAYMNKPISSGELEARLIKCLKQRDALNPIYQALDDGDYAKAIKACDEHIKKGSRHKNWSSKTKGELLIKLCRWQEAQTLYKEVINERPLFWAQLGYANVLAAQGLDEEALQNYQQAYQENPASLEAFEGAARTLIKLGDPIAAQNLLEQTTRISTRSVTRQKLLSEVCKMNGDFEGAAKASRLVVKSAEHGIHKSAENELDLADNLTEAALQSNDEDKSKKLATEALSTLQKTQKNYDSVEVKIQSKLVESRTYASMNDDKSAQASLNDAVETMHQSVHKPELRTQLELAKSYYQTGHKDQAKSLLKELAEQYKDDPEVSAKLDKLVDEPITTSGKKEVVDINKTGISMFEKGQYKEAAQYFNKATQFFPKHLGIRLNIIQAMLYDMKTTGPQLEQISKCNIHLSAIQNIKEDNRQFKRYLSFKQTLETLLQHLKKKGK